MRQAAQGEQVGLGVLAGRRAATAMLPKARWRATAGAVVSTSTSVRIWLRTGGTGQKAQFTESSGGNRVDSPLVDGPGDLVQTLVGGDEGIVHNVQDTAA